MKGIESFVGRLSKRYREILICEVRHVFQRLCASTKF